MIARQVDPSDVKDIKQIIEDLFAKNSPLNSDGTSRPILKPEEAGLLVDKVLSELGRRGYFVGKPK